MKNDKLHARKSLIPTFVICEDILSVLRVSAVKKMLKKILTIGVHRWFHFEHISEGSRKISAARLVAMMKAARYPNWATGSKRDSPNTRKPRARAVAAEIIAPPTLARLC